MDELMKVLQEGFKSIAEVIEQGVNETHEYRKAELTRRRKETMKKVLEKGVGNETEQPRDPAVPEEENRIGEIGVQ
jgi:hypothetical protein